MIKVLSCFMLMITLSACASTEVNYNTLDIAGTYDTILTKQVVFNILKTYNDRFSVPAYARVATQTSQTQDSANPTFTTPFNAQSTIMQTAASVVSGKAFQTAGSGISLQIQASRQQNYTLSPVVDPDQLRRLRTIYQYVTGKISDYQFEADYPIIEVSGSTPSGANTTTITQKDGIRSTTVTVGSNTPKKDEVTYVRRDCKIPDLNGCRLYRFIKVSPDKTFIKPPGCIMCDYGEKRAGQKNVFVLHKNVQLKGETCQDIDLQELTTCKNSYKYTLFYPPGTTGDDASPVYANGASSIALRGEAGVQGFYELVLFTQEASSQGTGSPASGGQSDGRKTSPLQTFSGPGASSGQF